ncbi:hypothetical protein BH23PLA1_BH23PLA1_23840 [soil metagenome]
MTIRTRTLAACLSLSAVIALPLTAQEPDEAPPAQEEKTTRKTYPQYRRVPTYFAQVGLSDQQRNEIYTIRGMYQSQIDEFNQQILQLKAQEMGECEAILTEAQKKLLDQRRATSRATPGPEN